MPLSSRPKKYSSPAKVVRTVYPLFEKALPKTAFNWARKQFFRPLKFKVRSSELQLMAKANQSTIQVNNKSVVLYRWGTTGPTIFMQHGWAGRATQFSAFIAVLNKKGYQVIAADAPAHGNSSGKETSAFEMMETDIKIIKTINNLIGCVGHSLGGMVLLNLLAQDQFKCKLALIAVPSKGDVILDAFKRILGASNETITSLQNYISEHYPISLHELFSPIISSEKSQNIYIVHDKEDKQVSQENFATLAGMLPQAKTLVTEKLGHIRILFDDNVVQNVVNWLTDEEIVPEQ